MDCQKKYYQRFKMVGKIYFQESKGEPFKACVKRQDVKKTDYKSITAKQVVN